MTKTKLEKRQRRKFHVRNRLMRDGAQVRLTVTRSSKHISAQVIDAGGRTLCGVSSTKKALASELAGKKKTERAAVIGKEIARLAKEKGVSAVVFDRGNTKFHGRVKALAEAARAEGLKF
jgi:large subunit ribosomal protein L18